MARKIVKVLIRFGIAIVLCVIFGLLFKSYSETLSKDRQDDVLIKAIPFVANFVAILLGFICLIVISAIVLNGRIPHRTHRPIEIIIILGIFMGVLGLFQPWNQFGYKFSFVLLLLSTLGFTLWSHIIPPPAHLGPHLPPISLKAHLAGLVVAVVAVAVLAPVIISYAEPEAPYGYLPKVWANIYEGKPKGEAVIQQNEDDYNEMKPVYIFVSLMAGGILYVIAREVAAQAFDRTGAPLTQNKETHGLAVLQNR